METENAKRRRVGWHDRSEFDSICPWNWHSCDPLLPGVEYPPGPGLDCHQSDRETKIYFSETDFASAHYQSIRPREENNVVETFLIQNDTDRRQSSAHCSSDVLLTSVNSTTNCTALELSETVLGSSANWQHLEIFQESFHSVQVVIEESHRSDHRSQLVWFS